MPMLSRRERDLEAEVRRLTQENIRLRQTPSAGCPPVKSIWHGHRTELRRLMPGGKAYTVFCGSLTQCLCWLQARGSARVKRDGRLWIEDVAEPALSPKRAQEFIRRRRAGGQVTPAG